MGLNELLIFAPTNCLKCFSVHVGNFGEKKSGMINLIMRLLNFPTGWRFVYSRCTNNIVIFIAAKGKRPSHGNAE